MLKEMRTCGHDRKVPAANRGIRLRSSTHGSEHEHPWRIEIGSGVTIAADITV